MAYHESHHMYRLQHYHQSTICKAYFFPPYHVLPFMHPLVEGVMWVCHCVDVETLLTQHSKLDNC